MIAKQEGICFQGSQTAKAASLESCLPCPDNSFRVAWETWAQSFHMHSNFGQVVGHTSWGAHVHVGPVSGVCQGQGLRVGGTVSIPSHRTNLGEKKAERGELEGQNEVRQMWTMCFFKSLCKGSSAAQCLGSCQHNQIQQGKLVNTMILLILLNPLKIKNYYKLNLENIEENL